jgi:hypothetical protein
MAHSTPTNQKSSIAPIFFSTHPLVSGIQKKSLPGKGGVFLTRGKREVEVQALGDVTAC